MNELNQDTVRKIATKLEQHFPDISSVNAALQAQDLAAAPSWGKTLHHGGASDRDALRALESQLRKVQVTVNKLTPWSSTALEYILHKRDLGSEDLGKSSRWPRDFEELQSIIEIWVAAARAAELSLELGRPSHGKNWEAVAVIDRARRAWKANTGKSPPPERLNEATGFASFLADLFGVLEIPVQPGRAYDAWYDAATDPNSLLDPSDMP